MSGIVFGLFICSIAIVGRCADTRKGFFAEADTLMENVEAAFDRQDAEGVAEYFTSDGTFLEPEEDIAQGREEIAEEFKEFFQMGITNLEQTTVEAEPLSADADTGYAQGYYAAFDKQGRIHDQGKYLTVLVREDDKLKIRKAMYNTNVHSADDGHDEL